MSIKGKISLKEFIHSVKEDLVSAIDEDAPLLTLDKVQLEVSFGVDVEAKGGFQFFVFDSRVKAGAAQSHKVTIDLTPIMPKANRKLRAQTRDRRRGGMAFK